MIYEYDVSERQELNF